MKFKQWKIYCSLLFERGPLSSLYNTECHRVLSKSKRGEKREHYVVFTLLRTKGKDRNIQGGFTHGTLKRRREAFDLATFDPGMCEKNL
jgi:hypothetical protein